MHVPPAFGEQPFPNMHPGGHTIVAPMQPPVLHATLHVAAVGSRSLEGGRFDAHLVKPVHLDAVLALIAGLGRGSL